MTMLYKFTCIINDLNDPSLHMKAWNPHETHEIFHFIVKGHNGRYATRIIKHKNRDQTNGDYQETNKGTDIPLLQWEFNIRKYILSFMEPTLSPFNHAKTILAKEARKTKPNIFIKKIP